MHHFPFGNDTVHSNVCKRQGLEMCQEALLLFDCDPLGTVLEAVGKVRRKTMCGAYHIVTITVLPPKAVITLVIYTRCTVAWSFKAVRAF